MWLPKRSAAVAAVLLFVESSSGATLRIADWNVGNKPNNATDDSQLSTIMTYAGASHPVDILAMAETDTASGPATATDFSGVFGKSYSSIMAASDGGGDRTGFVYNPSTVSLVSSTTIGGITHPSLRAQFRPVGTDGSRDFYMYAIHLQSGSTSQIKNQRVSQAQIIRADADVLGSANVIVAGDFNNQKADDVSPGVGAYRTFNAAGNGQVFDPVNEVGDWHGNAAFKSVLTNDPDASMDDRFDMQLISGELTDGHGLDYVTGSYHVVGNDGSFAINSPIDTGTGAPPSVLSALEAFSDHLPVIADYSLGIPDRVTGIGIGDDINGDPLRDGTTDQGGGAIGTSVPEPNALLVTTCTIGVALTRRSRHSMTESSSLRNSSKRSLTPA